MKPVMDWLQRSATLNDSLWTVIVQYGLLRAGVVFTLLSEFVPIFSTPRRFSEPLRTLLAWLVFGAVTGTLTYYSLRRKSGGTRERP